MEEWKKIEEKMAQLPLSQSRNVQRFLSSGAAEVEPDKQGRIVLPAHLREYAHLEKDVVVTGACDKAEIWDKAHWEACTGELTSEMMAEAIDSMDF